MGGGQRAVDRAAGGEVRVPVERREGVDAVVAGADLELLGRSRRVADRKDVGVHGLALADPFAHPLQIADVGGIVDAMEVAVGNCRGAISSNNAGRVDFSTDGSDPDRRLDVAAFAHVVDEVAVVDHQRDSPVGGGIGGRSASTRVGSATYLNGRSWTGLSRNETTTRST